MPAGDPNAPNEPVLLAASLVKQFAGRRVVDGVDLRCQAGQVLGLLGANGAGKTTTLRLCYGFLQPDADAIRVAGIDRRAEPEAAARRVGVCTQDDTFDSDFTVRGNLEQMSRYFRPRPPALKARIAALFMTAFFQALFAAYIRMHYQKTWEGQLIIQVRLEHVVWGEVLWAATLGTVYALIVVLVLAGFSVAGWLDLHWASALLIVPLLFWPPWPSPRWGCCSRRSCPPSTT